MAARRLRSTPILSPASRTMGAESMIPPGVGSMPIIRGIVARASPTTFTSSSSAVSDTNRYGVVSVNGICCHSTASRFRIAAGVTPSSTASTKAETTMASPILTFSRNKPTRTTRETKIVTNAYIYVTPAPTPGRGIYPFYKQSKQSGAFQVPEE
jgi:hypothetical protein